MVKAKPGAKPPPLSGHGGTARQTGRPPRGGRRPEAKTARQAFRARVADRRRKSTDRPKEDPWSPESLARKDAAQRLVADAWERLDPRRAAVIRRCGFQGLAVDEDTGAPVLGESGLYVAEATECGSRLCPWCARRASRRARASVVERLRELADTADRARWGGLASRWDLRADRDALRAARADRWARGASVRAEVAADARATRAPRSASLSAQTAVELQETIMGEAVALRAFDGVVGGFQVAAAKRVAWDRYQNPDPRDLVMDGVVLDRPVVDDDGAADLAAPGWRSLTARAKKKATRAHRRALAREDAAGSLALVESQAVNGALGAATSRASAAVAAYVEAVETVDTWQFHGPVELHARDRARALGRVVVRGNSAQAADRAAALWQRQQRDRVLRHLAARARTLLQEGKRLVDSLRRERSRARASAASARLWRDSDVVFLTLTARDVRGESADAGLDRLLFAFGKLIRRRVWTSVAAGALVKIEVERSTPQTRRRKALRDLADITADEEAADDVDGMPCVSDEQRAVWEAGKRRAQELLRPTGRWWHPHIHIALSSGNIDRRAFWAAWAECLDVDLDDCTVDVRRPTGGAEGVAAELTKYLTKPVGLGALSVDEVADLAKAVSGRRLIRCLGALRGVVVEADPRRAPRGSSTVLEGAIGDGLDAPLGFTVERGEFAGVEIEVRRDVWRHGRVDVDGTVRVGVQWERGPAAREAWRQNRSAVWQAHVDRRARAALSRRAADAILL